jgi:predicted porin
MGTAALAMALSAGAVSAQEWSARVGGFFVGGIGYVDYVGDEDDNVGFARDAEVIFTFQLTADNGLTFGAQTQLESGDNADDGRANVDEAFMWVEGSFGRVEFGEEDGAASDFSTANLVLPPFATAQDGGGFLFDFYDTGAINLDSTGGTTSDSLKISYFTPNFSGFQAGVSFVPSVGAENGRSVPLDGQTNTVEVGASYGNTFGSFDFGIGVAYNSDTTPSEEDDQSWGGSAMVGFGGFNVGLSYAWYEGDADDTQTLGGGVTYGTGPWNFGIDAAFNIDGPDAEDGDYGIAAGASYALAPGVSTGLTLEYAEDDLGDDEAFAAGVWMGMNF